MLGPELDRNHVGMLVPLAHWRASKHRISSVNFIEVRCSVQYHCCCHSCPLTSARHPTLLQHARLEDVFLMTAASDGVTVWTLAGSMVGKFGQVQYHKRGCIGSCVVSHDCTPCTAGTCQSKLWRLTDASTYRTRLTHWVEAKDSARFGVNWRLALPHHASRKAQANRHLHIARTTTDQSGGRRRVRALCAAPPSDTDSSLAHTHTYTAY